MVGLYLELPDDVQDIKKNIKKLVDNKLAPRTREIDESDEFAWDIRKLLAKQGVFSLPFPEEYGGVDGRWLTFCVVIEEIARVNAAVSMSVGCTALGTGALCFAGTEEQKRKYIPRLVTGELIPAFGLTEPNAGSDASGLKTKAVRQGDEYVINGSKCFITQGNIADIVTVAAKTTDSETGKKSISLFIVEKGTPGFSYGTVEKKMGLHGSPTAELIFEDVRVPAINRIGAEGEGFKILMRTLDRSRIMVGAQCLGIAQGALDEAVKYARTREQFGQPISKFQGVQFLLAEMQTLVEASRHLVYDAANRWDQKIEPITQFASITKLFCSEACVKVTDKAVQVLGGYGYMREYNVERMMRDAKHATLVEGTSQIQKLIIARGLLGKEYV